MCSWKDILMKIYIYPIGYQKSKIKFTKVIPT